MRVARKVPSTKRNGFLLIILGVSSALFIPGVLRGSLSPNVGILMNMVKRASLRLVAVVCPMIYAIWAVWIIDDVVQAGTWESWPNTDVESVCPPHSSQIENWPGPVYDFPRNCHAAIDAWTDGIIDTQRNRMLTFGGGHNDYRGNEVYALNFGSKTMERLGNPSPGFTRPGDPNDECVDELPDGTPTSRHTFGNMAYLEHRDELFFYGGSRGCGSGGFGEDTWTLALDTLTWTKRNPAFRNEAGNPSSSPGPGAVVAMYDPVTQLVFMRNTRGLYTYDADADVWQKREGRSIARLDYSGYGIEPEQRLFVILHHTGVKAYPLDGPYVQTSQATTGPQDMMADNRGPGFDWDPTRQTFVAWDASDGGINPNSVYELDPVTWQWTRHDAPGPNAMRSGGIYGRWKYVASVGGFVGVPCGRCDAVVWKFNEGPLDTIPPAAPTGLEVQ